MKLAFKVVGGKYTVSVDSPDELKKVVKQAVKEKWTALDMIVEVPASYTVDFRESQYGYEIKDFASKNHIKSMLNILEGEKFYRDETILEILEQTRCRNYRYPNIYNIGTLNDVSFESLVHDLNHLNELGIEKPANYKELEKFIGKQLGY